MLKLRKSLIHHSFPEFILSPVTLPLWCFNVKPSFLNNTNWHSRKPLSTGLETKCLVSICYPQGMDLLLLFLTWKIVWISWINCCLLLLKRNSSTVSKPINSTLRSWLKLSIKKIKSSRNKNKSSSTSKEKFKASWKLST